MITRRREPDPKKRAAFGILRSDNHGTIKMTELRTPRTAGARQLFLDALSVSDAGWEAWKGRLERINEEVRREAKPRGDEAGHSFQNTIVRISDDHGHTVADYFLEFDTIDEDRGRFARFFHTDAIHSVHAYGDDKSHRSIYVDITRLYDQIDKVGEALLLGLRPHPLFVVGQRVGYTDLTEGSVGAIRLERDVLPELFAPDRTLLLDITLSRQVSPEVFHID